jgi:4-amino-4-deoxy-L-arabinose transferase-like glycosyltransferase
LFKFFIALLCVTVLLRIFYAGHLYHDDGFWIVTAQEILQGKAIYREIYFDKPPILPLLYASLFKLFGTHLLTIRLFTILYSLVTSVVLYLFGSWLYDQPTGKLAALFFTVFSTTYITGDMQGLNTDFLMVLPYTMAVFLFTKAILKPDNKNNRWQLICGGLLVGISFQINPKGIFGLIFFLLLLLIYSWITLGSDKNIPISATVSQLTLWILLVLLGFIVGTVPFWLYIIHQKAFSYYWNDVFVWGSQYTSYHSWYKIGKTAVRKTINYFAMNNTLFIALVFALVTTIREIRRYGLQSIYSEERFRVLINPSLIAFSWLAVSFLALALGGRFYGHYFFQILPALCLIGSHGTKNIILKLKKCRAITRRIAYTILILGLIFTFIRFHGLTMALAIHRISNSENNISSKWQRERFRSEEIIAATLVRSLPGYYLFVWGYRPELYYWSGLKPASRFLSTQTLTGVPADLNHTEGRSIMDERILSANRQKLAEELRMTRPNFIIDEVRFYNTTISMDKYAELREVLSTYEEIGMVEHFFIYKRR